MFRQRIISTAVALAAFVAFGQAVAETRQSPAAMALQRRLVTDYPNTKFTSVSESQVNGIFEVVMGTNVVYMDETGRYWFFGNVFDTKTQKDLTAQRKDDVARIDMSKLNKSYAMKTVKGNGARVMYVFSDPNCGYCKLFEKSVAEMTDVTIYTFVVPLLSDDSFIKASAIWCSNDRADTYRRWMVQGIEPKGKPGCAAPNADVSAMAQAVGVSATPTIISADGRVQRGAMGAADLNNWLNSSKQDVSMLSQKTRN